MKEEKAKSILWISFFQARGLDNMSLVNTLRQLRNLGNNVSLATVTNKNKPIPIDKKIRLISFPLNSRPLLLPVAFSFLLMIYLPIFVVASKIDTVIIEPSIHIVSAFPLLAISKLKKTRFILDIRSTPVEIKGLQGKLLKLWFTISVLIAKNQFDGITTITPLMKKKISQDFKIDPERIGVWTSGVSLDLFNPQKYAAESSELRKTLGLSNKFVVFYHGAFTPTRGLAETVEAIKILSPKYPDIYFFLLGDGPFAPTLKETAKRENLERNVIIAKPVPQSEVPKYIGISDVTIIPLPDHAYWRFQSPLKLLEYLAMEKTVIATDIPAHRGVMGQEKCGIYLSSIEPKKIGEALEFAYLNRDSLPETGKIGRRLIEKEYSWEKVVGKLQEFLQSLD